MTHSGAPTSLLQLTVTHHTPHRVVDAATACNRGRSAAPWLAAGGAAEAPESGVRDEGARLGTAGQAGRVREVPSDTAPFLRRGLKDGSRGIQGAEPVQQQGLEIVDIRVSE